MSTSPKVRGIKRLEITMRDVLDGLEDAAVFMNYHSNSDIVEILSIEPPGRTDFSQSKIIPLKPSTQNSDNADIVEYLIQRELKKSA